MGSGEADYFPCSSLPSQHQGTAPGSGTVEAQLVSELSQLHKGQSILSPSIISEVPVELETGLVIGKGVVLGGSQQVVVSQKQTKEQEAEQPELGVVNKVKVCYFISAINRGEGVSWFFLQLLTLTDAQFSGQFSASV